MEEVNTFSCEGSYTTWTDLDDKEGFCYRFVDERATWEEMKTECESDGGHLADMGSYIEHTAVLGFLGQIGRLQSVAWISTNDRENEGVYLDSNGEPVPLTLWCPDAPEDPDQLPANQDCAITSTMGWNDNPCDNKYFGICEQEPQFYR